MARKYTFEQESYRLGFTKSPSGGFNYTCLHDGQTVAYGWIAGYSNQEATSMLRRIVKEDINE